MSERTKAFAAGLLIASALAGVSAAEAGAVPLSGLHVEVGSKTAPVVVSVPSRSAELKFKVNGKHVSEDDVNAASPKVRVVALSASDGLRAGRNTISAVVTRGS